MKKIKKTEEVELLACEICGSPIQYLDETKRLYKDSCKVSISTEAEDYHFHKDCLEGLLVDVAESTYFHDLRKKFVTDFKINDDTPLIQRLLEAKKEALNQDIQIKSVYANSSRQESEFELLGIKVINK